MLSVSSSSFREVRGHVMTLNSMHMLTPDQKVCVEVEEIALSESQAKIKAAATVRSAQKLASSEQRSVTSVRNPGLNHAPTLLERTRDASKEPSINASQKLGPTTSSLVAENPTPGTWKESTGRTHGRDGYEIGDLTRVWVQRASKRFQEHFGTPQQKGKPKRCDASLMNKASRVPATGDGSFHMPSSFRSLHEGATRDILAKMVKSRATAKRLLEKSLPLLELRLQELKARPDLDTQDKYDLYRIHSGNLSSLDPLKKYRNGLESVHSHCDIVFDSSFVQEVQKLEVCKNS